MPKSLVFMHREGTNMNFIHELFSYIDSMMRKISLWQHTLMGNNMMKMIQTNNNSWLITKWDIRVEVVPKVMQQTCMEHGVFTKIFSFLNQALSFVSFSDRFEPFLDGQTKL